MIDKQKEIEEEVQLLMSEADEIIVLVMFKIKYEKIMMYYDLGKMISKYKRTYNTGYGNKVINNFCEELSKKYGSGFKKSNVYSAIKFYEIYSRYLSTEKFQPAGIFNKLTWSHLLEILVLNDIEIMNYYINEIKKKNLTRLQLRKQIKLKGYERKLAHQKNGKIVNEIEKTLSDLINLDIPNIKRTEKELEEEIIKNIFHFMQEIGDSVYLCHRQYRLNISDLIYKIDLVLYDKENKHYILIDLKINKVKQKDISQMQFYIKHFNQYEKGKEDNMTIGIILCETKDFRVINDSHNIYQIKYLNEILNEKELLNIIEENKVILLQTKKLEI